MPIEQKDNHQLTEKERAFAVEHLRLIEAGTKVDLIYRFGPTTGYEGIMVGLNPGDDTIDPDFVVFSVMSAPGPGGIWYAGTLGNGTQLGPAPAYESFEEAFVYGAVVTRKTCEKIAVRLSGAQGADARPSNVDKAPDTLVFSTSEIFNLKSLARRVAQNAGTEASTEFTTLGPNASAVGIGLVTAGELQMLVGSFVKSMDSSGTSVTVRGPKGAEIPQSLSSFDSLESAIKSSHQYFEFVGTQYKVYTQKQKPSIFAYLKKSIFG